jgi:lipopolysaccharide transport system ATP-binding protein
MNAISVRVERLGKRYRVGEHLFTVQEMLSRSLSYPARVLARKPATKTETNELWALRDVSFDLKEDEIIGIIGRNGAGKSTLLKLLARITEPTEGSAILRGRVGALLEVGTGFHPDLTGRENLYMNGAIIGMRRAEIDRKFDEIVAFAEIERFIDTPVKRYSSGMQVRLAFSVAAHLEAEIMLVDELLAVGDAEFQKRCLGRMEQMGRSGRTVVFVSHSMTSIQRLCPRVLLLDRGRLIADGRAHDAIGTYLDSGLGTSAAREWRSPSDAPGDDAVRLKAVRVRTSGTVSEQVDIRSPVEIEVEYWHLSRNEALRPTASLHFYNEQGNCLFVSSDQQEQRWFKSPRTPGVVKATCHIPGHFLAEGTVYVHAFVGTINPTRIHVEERDAVAFRVVDRTVGEGVRGEYVADWPGLVRPMLDWEVEHHPVISSS